MTSLDIGIASLRSAADRVRAGWVRLWKWINNFMPKGLYARSLLLNLIELDAQLANLLRALTIRVENAAGILPLSLCPGHFIACSVLLALQPFELGNQPPAAILQRRERFQLSIDVHAALLHPSTYLFLMLADECRIQHE